MCAENGSGKTPQEHPVEDYDEGFRESFLEFVKKDALLKPIYNRFEIECRNITEVIRDEKAKDVDLFSLDKKFGELTKGIEELGNEIKKFDDEEKKLTEDKKGKSDEDIKKLDDKIKKLGKVKKELREAKGRRLVSADTDFHEELFRIGGNVDILKEFTAKMDENLQNEIWWSIIHNTNHYMKLKESHSEIIESIRKGKNNKEQAKNEAIAAMQKHFAVILVHYCSAAQQRKPS